MMKSYQSFVFDGFTFDPENGRIDLRYAMDDDVRFLETIHLPMNEKRKMKNRNLDAALQALHLIGGVSYYKTCCPEEIIVRGEPIDEDQERFFQTVYENGLGEFAYRNNMNLWGKIRFPHSASPDFRAPSEAKEEIRKYGNTEKKKVLIPLGGGKDSIVTIERMRKAGHDITLLRMGNHPLITALVEELNLPCLNVERTLAPKLFRLNEQGAFNGHVPITAYLSFLAVVVAELHGFDAVVMSNERSADEGNAEHFGRIINHQWSKSAACEEMIRAYVRDHIDPALRYENPLREMTELEIVGEFVRYPQYFELFTSCNANWKLLADPERTHAEIREHDRKKKSWWCQKCPKCTFLFLLFAAHLPKAQVLRIFGGNLFEDASLLPLFRQLLGIEGFKPFECVGTPEETREALSMIRARGEFDETVVLQSLIEP